MSIPASFIDELKNRVDLAAVVGRRVKLTKRGREYQGLCPFHNEKTPSFSVVVDKGFYHCFGCGEHGSAIDFLMKVDGLSFPESIERLAQDAGMEVPQASPQEQERQNRRRGLHEVMAQVAAWYESQLSSAVGLRAREYLIARGLDDKTIRHFRLGYAPASRDGIKSAMINRNIPEADLIESGMLIRPDEGASYDRFRDRVMFPITDRRGRIVAFGGRTMGDAKAKYLNSPETPIFHKGHLLYNLAGASKPAYAAGSVLVVEGYMDVIGLARVGIHNAVAPLGTAVTEDQLKMLWRMVPEPTLCFDGDAAGQRAAFRAAERALPLLKPGFSLRFVELPAGEDPDSLVNRKGSRAMDELVSAAQPLSELIWQRCLAEGPTDTPERRAGLRKRLRDLSAAIEDPSIREFYITHYNNQLDAVFGGNRQNAGYEKGSWRKKSNLSFKKLPKREIGGVLRRERTIIGLVLNHPGVSEDVFDDLASLQLETPIMDNLRAEILKNVGMRKTLDVGALKDDLPNSNLVQLIEDLTGEGAERLEPFARPQASAEAVIEGWTHITRLHRLEELRRELTMAERALGDDTTEQAFARFVALQDAVRQAEAEAIDVGIM
jgi:DNA primase